MFAAHLHRSRLLPLVCSRWLVPVLIGLLTPTLALAQPRLSGDTVEGMPGELVAMAFAWTTAGDAAAIQLDLVWDDSVLTAGDLVAGDALVDHVLDWEEIDPGRLRITAVTATPSPLVDGTLVYVPFQIAAEAPMGPRPVVVESVVVASTSGSAVSLVDVVEGMVIVLAGGPSEPPPIDIPSLGTWGLLLLAALLAASACRRIGGGVLPLVLFGIGLQMALTAPAGAQPIPGDANGDGKVDAADIPVIVDEILERAAAPGDPDCNGDTAVDVIDTVCVANAVPPESNAPPVLDPIGDLQVREREIVAFVATATDPDLPDDTLTWSLVEKPVGATIDRTNGSLLWVPTRNQVGPNPFRVRVTDEAGASDEETFDVAVRSLGRPPVLTEIPDQQVVEKTHLSVDADATDPDLPDDTLVFDLLLAPAGMTVDPDGGLISWTPTNAQIGSHDVTVRVTDQEGLLDFTPFVVEVLEINVAPTASDDVFEARLGVPLSVAAPGVLDNDSDPNGDALTAVLDTGVTEGDLTLSSDGSFEYLLEPPDRTTPVALELQCEASRTAGVSDFQARGGTLAVGDLEGDGDLEIVGLIDLADATFLAELWILNAADCSEQTFLDIEDHGSISFTSHLGLLDLDGDGDLEIVGTRNRFPAAQGGASDDRHLIAFHHDGTLAWPGDGASESSPLLDATPNSTAANTYQNAGPTFADLDADGTVEIVMPFSDREGNSHYSGLVVYNSEDGSLAWDYQSATLQGANGHQRLPLVIDLDLDGTMEILIHNNVVSHLGVLELEFASEPDPPGTGSIGHLVVSAANFDDDAFPEIVARDWEKLYLFEHDGTVKWEQPRRNRAEGQITVADFDGDDEVEIVSLACGALVLGSCDPYFLEMVDTDGSVLWSHQGQAQYEVDDSDRDKQNAIAFDANRDGALDVVWWHIPTDTLFIFDGRDGSELDSVAVVPENFAGDQGFVSIADVDGDGQAELIVSATNGLDGSTQVWQGSAANPLPSAPPYRNQWLFNEAMVEPDLSIPTNPVPHWLQPGLNGWFLLKPEPDPLIGTQQTFTYHANDGALDSNVATVTLDILPAGGPPRFLTEPDARTTRGFRYVYAPIVVDPDLGDVVSFRLTAGPPGMTIDPATGAVRWLPDANGTYPVTILATDTIGFAVDQSWGLEVGDPVTTPDVVGLPRATAEATLLAADLLVGRVSEATHPTIPAGSVSGQTPIGGSVAEFGAEVDLVISLGPAPEDVDDDGDGFTENQGDCNDGDDTVFPGAPDPNGDGIDQSCDGFDGSEPVAEVVVEPATLDLLAGESRQLRAWAIFGDGTAQIATAIADWQSTNGATATVSPSGRVSAVAANGPAQITATVDAVAGNAAVTVADRDGADDDAPTVEITSPEDGESVFGPIDVTGTADDPNLVRYELEISPAGKESYTKIGGGTSPVVGGVLGRLDPTLMLNSLYDLRLTVLDAGGNETIDKVTVQLDGQQKVGNFTLTFIDLQIPLSGIPITVTRTYDSRDKRQGDFGVGWRLALRTVELSCTDPLGEGWTVVQSGLSFVLLDTREHRCSITLGDGRVEEFDLVVSPKVSPLVPFPPFSQRASFRPRPGTLGTLQSLDNNNLTLIGAQPGEVVLLDDSTLEPFKPSRFLYTAADGATAEISTNTGLMKFSDLNGNSVTITGDSIVHSSGVSVTLTRDELGRVSSITDPNGQPQTYRYSAAGNLVAHTDPEGNATRFFYDRDHGLIRVEDPLGRTAGRNEYDDEGRLIAQVDALGARIEYTHDVENRTETMQDRLDNTTVWEYDERGNVTTVIDALGNRRERTYDADDNLLTATDPLGNAVVFEYDADGNRTRQTDPLGNTTSWTYDDAGRVLTRTDPDGGTTTNTYDGRGNLVRRSDPAGDEEQFAYDGVGNLLEHQNALGNTTSWQFDGRGFQVSRTDARGRSQDYTRDAIGNILTDRHTFENANGSAEVEWVYDYDARGLFSSISAPSVPSPVLARRDFAGDINGATDPLGNSWDLVEDPAGNVIRRVIDGQPPLELSYDAEGRETDAVLPSGGVVTRTYDRVGRPVSIQLPATGATTQAWDVAGRLESTTDALGNTTSFEYDAAGRRTSSNRPGGATTSYVYDVLGQAVSTSDPEGGVSTFGRDEIGRITAATLPDGSTIAKTYDPVGNVLAATDERGLTWSSTYGAFGLLETVSGPAGVSASYGYDSHGNMTTITDPNDNTTTLVHDELGRVVRTQRPGGEIATCEVDPLARPTSCVDFNGRTTTFVYDPNARRIDQIAFDGTESRFRDPDGRLVQVIDPRGTTTIDRDALGRIIRWTDPTGRTATSDYDAVGRQVSLNTDAGVTTFAFNGRDALTAIGDASGTTTLQRNLNDQTTGIVWPDGTTLERQVDAVGRALRLTYRSAASEVLLDLRYTRGIGGRIESIESSAATGSTSTTTYSYNSLEQLVEELVTVPGEPARSTVYTYDDNGNLSSRADSTGTFTFTYDTNDRVVAGGDRTFEWDANGNLLSRTDGTTTETLAYDTRDRLVRFERVGTDPTVIRYVYDHDGLLAARIADGIETRLVWDRAGFALPRLMEERDAAGSLMRRYAHDGLTPTHFVDQAGNLTVLLTDHLATVRGHAQGANVDGFEYDAYGRALGNEPDGLGYAGAYTDPTSGLVFMRARWYDPDLARFLQVDPVGPDPADPRTLNRYAYSLGDPVNRFDPSGNYSLAEFSTRVAIIFTTIGILDVIRRDPREVLTSGFGLRNVIANFGERSDAIFVPAAGRAGLLGRGVRANIGLTAGFEALYFFKLNRLATYFFFGAELSASFGNGSGASGVTAGVSAPANIKGRVFNTPTPDDYRGWFIAASGSLGFLPPTVTRNFSTGATGGGSAQGNLPAGVGGSIFWSPAPTYYLEPGLSTPRAGSCLACEARFSHGFTLGARSGKGVSFSLSFTYYFKVFDFDINPLF